MSAAARTCKGACIATSPKTALIVCPVGGSPGRRLLGLSIGERLLLALQAAGITSVTFVGRGEQPVSARTSLVRVWPDAWPPDDVLVVAADAVFDRGLVGSGAGGDLPIALTSADEARMIARAPEAWLDTHAGACDTNPGFALRVIDGASARRAKRALLRSLRKPIDGIVSRYLNRYVSIFLSSWLVRLPVRPNHLTLVFTLIGLASGIVTAIADPPWLVVLGAGLFQAQSILDGCDGELARLTYRFSRSGQWLDSIGDDVTNYAFCFGLAFGQAHARGIPLLLYAGIVTVALQCIASALLYRRMMIMGTGDLLAIPDMVTGEASAVVRFVRQLAKRDTFVFVIAVLAVANPVVAFAVYAAGTVPMVIGVVENERRIAWQARS